MTSNGSSSNALSEDYIQDAFHNYLKSSLRQAKAERLLDEDILSSAEGDLMITGPALCLYFAALRSVSNHPIVYATDQSPDVQPIHRLFPFLERG